MDALSDVLRAVRLTGAVFFDIRAAEPWVAATPPGSAIVGAMFPGAEHLISYHVITAGSCWAGLPDAAPIRLHAGDIIVFPHGDPHMLSSSPGMRTTRGPVLVSPAERWPVALQLLHGRQRRRRIRAVRVRIPRLRRAALQSAADGAAARDPRQR